MTDKPVNVHETLLMAIVQAQDADIVDNVLQRMNVNVTRLPSTGAFLGRRNATLLIGIPPDNQEEILAALKENCRQRVEYISVPLESAPLPLPAPTPVTVGGATVFALEIEYSEEM